MNAKQVSDILVAGADACNAGLISVERYSALNKALWDICRELKIDKDVSSILRELSNEEMSISMKTIS